MDYLLSRFLCAALSGILLSQSGSLLQLTTRNVLASPSTLGFDGLSVLWILIAHSALLAIESELSPVYLFLLGVPAFVMIGLFFAGHVKKSNVNRLVLIGLTFNLLVGAVFSLWQFLFMAFNLPFPVELWFGHFRYAEIQHLLVLLFVEIIILLGWKNVGRDLVLLSVGDEVARNFKARTTLTSIYIFISISIATFSVVSLFGVFSFLGLIFPLLSRRFFFRRLDLKGELFLGASINGVALMLIDILCYYLPVYGAEIPVGLIATSVGALSLIFLLWSQNSAFEIVAKKKK